MAIKIQFFKDHWMAIAGGLAGAIVIYVVYRAIESSSTAATSGPTDLSDEEAFQSINAAQAVQNGQTNAALTIAQSQSDAATAQINAQLSAVQSAYSAQEEINDSNNSTALALADKTGTSYGDYLDTQKAVALGQQATDLAVAQSHDNAGVTVAQSADATQYGVAQLQAGLDQQALDIADAAGLNHEGSKEQGIVAVIQAAINQPTAAVATQNAQGVAAANQTGFGISIPGVGSVNVG